MRQTIRKDFRSEDNILTNAYSVVLGSEDSTYGIKLLDGTIIAADSTAVDNPSTGKYSYQFSALPQTVYFVSWKIIAENGDDPQYAVEQIGPFQDPLIGIRGSTDIRGRFEPNKTGTIFLRVSNFEGRGVNAEEMLVDILDSTGATVITGTPDNPGDGVYAWDWEVPDDQANGEYFAQWIYSIDGTTYSDFQKLIVSDKADGSILYSGRVVEMRQALSAMITYAQAIPVYREPAKSSRDRKTFEFTFPRWNPSAGVRVYRNDIIVKSGYTIDHFNGKVVFDVPLTVYDRVEVGYNFRWYSDEQLDRFLSNATHLYNLTTPVTSMNLVSLNEMWIGVVLYGAAVDAIRNLMLSLQFQEPQLVFGGAERADKVFTNLEGLKKNYEETWKYALEQKKLGPYKGLTRFMSSPQFSIPGGRSRMFRYMFSSGT
jgi:hypothetical protein